MAHTTIEQDIIKAYGEPVIKIQGTQTTNSRSNAHKAATQLGIPCYCIAGARADRHITGGYYLYFYKGERDYTKPRFRGTIQWL